MLEESLELEVLERWRCRLRQRALWMLVQEGGEDPRLRAAPGGPLRR